MIMHGTCNASILPHRTSHSMLLSLMLGRLMNIGGPVALCPSDSASLSSGRPEAVQVQRREHMPCMAVPYGSTTAPACMLAMISRTAGLHDP